MAGPYAVVALIADRAGRFLAVSRKTDHEDLGFPGGKVELGETPEDAIIRELREETGLRVTHRDLRPALTAPDQDGRPCMAFDISSFEGMPQSQEGAWVGWVDPARLVDRRNTFRDYNIVAFKQKGISTDDLIETERPQGAGLPFDAALARLTGLESFPRKHITFLYGAEALAFTPAFSIAQPRLLFDRRQFEGLRCERVFGILTHQQRSLVPSSLFRHMHSLGDRCLSAVVALSPHRPSWDWQKVSSNIIECVPHVEGARLTLVKQLAAPHSVAIGTSVIVSRAQSLETIARLLHVRATSPSHT